MRQKRAKSYKKQMTVYLHTFKFREPYQTIVDNELVLVCEKSSFDISKGLNRTIQGEAKPMITQCCMQALYETKNQSAIDLAKTFERRRCNHSLNDPKPPGECIRSIVDIQGENKHRYIVASQDYDLRKQLRKVPGIPLIFMNRSVMVMEPLSISSSKFSRKTENAKLTHGLNDAKAGKVKEEKKVKDDSQPKKKRKGPKEPNPLSIKRAKKDDTNEPKVEDGEKKKRRRKHTKKTEGDDGEGDVPKNGASADSEE